MRINDTYQAEIEFVSPEEGGRDDCPQDHFVCPAQFEGSEFSWTMLLDFYYISGRERRANISYLVEQAPFESLKEGAKFELLEGSHVVATGTVTRAPKRHGEEEELEEIAEWVKGCAEWMLSHLKQPGRSYRSRLESVRKEHRNMATLLSHLDVEDEH